MPSEFLYADIQDFSTDIAALRAHYEDEIAHKPATSYFDGDTEYKGWSVTSRDGSISDGVKRISLNKSEDSTGSRRGVFETEICRGPLKSVLDRLNAMGFRPYRSRIMTLAGNHARMPFHKDAHKESWRLHVPIITTAGSFFEWANRSGGIIRKHLPADGRAWLVRVDVTHRAINLTPDSGARTHLLMSLSEPPSEALIGRDNMQVSALTAVESSQIRA